MKSRFLIRMTAPIVATSLLLLAVGLGTAWSVQRWQASVSQDLLVNVSGIRAAEELEILVREARTRLDHFLITGDRRYLAKVPELRTSIEHWLGEAEGWGITLDEQRLTSRVRRGNDRFWGQLDGIRRLAPDAAVAGEIRGLIDEVLVREMLEPAHEYLDLNEEQVRDAIEKNQAFADLLVYALLLLGTCGSAAGLLAGFGFARGLRRSLVQLSVLVRDTAGHLDVHVEPIRYSGADLAELENALRLVADRVRTMVEQLQQREREAILAQQLAAVGQLAAGMAHELRNPLTSMKILVQGALAGGGEEDEGDVATGRYLSLQDLSVLEEEIIRLEQLLQSFLDFARPPKPEKQLKDLRPLVEQTVAFVGVRAAALSAKVEILAPQSPVCAAVDAGQIRQVLLNLLFNAMEAMPGGGTVTVGLQSEGDGWLTLQVADRGIGLPGTLGERIFDPFTTTKDTGIGLGLSICKRLAAAHGGTLAGKNRPGGGAVFTLRLPQVPCHA
jgi:two-component system, NtrC family, sensor histidine kinase HydH